MWIPGDASWYERWAEGNCKSRVFDSNDVGYTVVVGMKRGSNLLNQSRRSRGMAVGDDSGCFQAYCKDLMGRVGVLHTKGGSFQTPHMFPVVDPNGPRFSSSIFKELGVHAIMTNAYLLRRARLENPPEDVHETLGFDETVATDSGAYQILGYGHVGVKPDDIVTYQEQINSDIGVILDIPTGYRSDSGRARWTVDETVKRADKALRVVTRTDILWVGPIQGGVHVGEVERSAQLMSKRKFDIYALGSPTEVMESQRFETLVDMIIAAKQNLPPGKPFHLFGAGHPSLFSFLVALGCDLFDSAAYALYARLGRYITSEGTNDLWDMEEFPCLCDACRGKSPRDVRKLETADRERLLSFHNLQACFAELRKIREEIRKGRLWDLMELRSRAHPALKRCLNRIAVYSTELERFTPVSKPRGIFHFGETSASRPEIARFVERVGNLRVHRGDTVLLLPGRWRRPYREDPRYRTVVDSLWNEKRLRICFYSIAFGPVPLELDETYPIPHTESAGQEDPMLNSAKAESVARFVRRLKPRPVIIAREGSLGETVERELLKTLPRSKIATVPGDGLKPDRFVSLVEKRIRAS